MLLIMEITTFTTIFRAPGDSSKSFVRFAKNSQLIFRIFLIFLIVLNVHLICLLIYFIVQRLEIVCLHLT